MNVGLASTGMHYGSLSVRVPYADYAYRAKYEQELMKYCKSDVNFHGCNIHRWASTLLDSNFALI